MGCHFFFIAMLFYSCRVFSHPPENKGPLPNTANLKLILRSSEASECYFDVIFSEPDLLFLPSVILGTFISNVLLDQRYKYRSPHNVYHNTQITLLTF